MIPTSLTIIDRQSDRRRWLALVVICFGQLMIVLDATIVNVALPAIQHDLQLSQANLTWGFTAYLITFGSFVVSECRAGSPLGPPAGLLPGAHCPLGTRWPRRRPASDRRPPPGWTQTPAPTTASVIAPAAP